MNNNMEKVYQIIYQILGKYELFDANYILEGLDLVGISNLNYWLNIVSELEQNKGLEILPYYVSLMKMKDEKEIKEEVKKGLLSLENFLFDNIYEDNKNKSL